MRGVLSPLILLALASVVGARPPALAQHPAAPGTPGSGRRIAPSSGGTDLLVAGSQRLGALLPAVPAAESDTARLGLPFSLGKPKIIFSLNPDDDLAAIRRAGFTHVLVSYLQGLPDEEQRRKLDEFQRRGLKVIYRLVDLVDHDRRAGNDALVHHAVLLLRDHPALAGWETFEETNLPSAVQIAVYQKIKGWDPRHPVITVLTNEYSSGWYHRTYSDDAQDVVLMDYYPYKRRYNGWIYISASVRALQAEQKRSVPIIPVIQAFSSAGVATAEDAIWPPPGGLEKQLNLWWSLGADAGAAFWLWHGNKEFPFVGLADRAAPAYALSETAALLARIPDGELPSAPGVLNTERGRSGATGAGPRGRHGEEEKKGPETVIPAARVWQARVNYVKNSGFERGLEGWGGYGESASPTDQAYAGHGAARMANSGTPRPIGVGQRVDVPVPPNATVTLSCCYKVVRETMGLQWMVGTTAYPAFGAAPFLEGKERLPPGDWRRAFVSAVNTTGALQRVTGVSVLSNAFTGEVLLDNFQLELAPAAGPYIAGAPSPSTRLVYHLRGTGVEESGVTGRQRRTRPLPPHPRALTPTEEWTLSGWSAPEMPPEDGSYACLAAISGAGTAPGQRGPNLELRLRVDSRRSDPDGWVGALEVAGAGVTALGLPIALAPGQPLFWALSSTRDGTVTLRAAPAGYRLASATARAALSLQSLSTLYLGTDSAGEHPLNGWAGEARLTPQALSPAAAQEQMVAGGSK